MSASTPLPAAINNVVNGDAHGNPVQSCRGCLPPTDGVVTNVPVAATAAAQAADASTPSAGSTQTMAMCLALILMSSVWIVFYANVDWKALLAFAAICVVALLLVRPTPSQIIPVQGIERAAESSWTPYEREVYECVTAHNTLKGALGDTGGVCHYKSKKDCRKFMVRVYTDDSVTFTVQAENLSAEIYLKILRYFKERFHANDYKAQHYRDHACHCFDKFGAPKKAEAHHVATEDWLKPYVKHALVAVLVAVSSAVLYKGFQEIPYYLPWDYAEWPLLTKVVMSSLCALLAAALGAGLWYWFVSAETTTAFHQDVLQRLFRWKK